LICLSTQGQIMISLLQEILEEFQKKIVEFDHTPPRTILFHAIPNKIKVVIGMRRTGKTYFLLQKIKEILSADPTLSTRILYLNFEDDRLLPFNATTLGKLLDSFYELYPENHHQHCYFFLDEIQNIPEWEIVIRRFFDTKKIDIFLTGS